MLSFLENCNSDGQAVFSDVIKSFHNYYIKRRNDGKIIEKADSIVTSPNFSESNAKKIILYNPLGRSFLAEYLYYNKSENNIIMLPNLWKSLSNEDIEGIRRTAITLLNEYYKKLEQKKIK